MYIRTYSYVHVYGHTPKMCIQLFNLHMNLILPLQVQIFKEDFEAEKSDRETAHAQRNEEGERYRQEISRLQSELEHTHKQLKSHKGNLSGLEDIQKRRQEELMHALECLKAAQEEVQAKTSQVKQYKKQHDQTTARVCIFVPVLV